MNTTNLLKNNLDKVLYDYLARVGALDMCENWKTFNRGDFFEMSITREPVKRNGLHEISKGDYNYNGEPVEIKLVSTKTKASNQLIGTTCKKYLIGFLSVKGLIIKLIDKKDLSIDKDNKINYKDNINKGLEI